MSNTPTQALTQERLEQIEKNVERWDTQEHPAIRTTYAQYLAFDAVDLLAEVHRLRSGLKRFLNPEDMGLSVSAWVRDTVREILGQPMVEGMPKEQP